MSDFVGPLPPGGGSGSSGLPTVGGPTVPLPTVQTPTLPPWVPPNQVNNPTRRDINSVGSSVAERTLSVSPWGTYVPLIFGQDVVGPIISLAHIRGSYLYLRLVWCVGEVEEIVEVTKEDGTASGALLQNDYLGTSGQGVDPILSNIDITGYADTMTGIGPDEVDLCYSVMVFRLSDLQGFPRLIAKIKGLKLSNPSPSVKTVVAGGGGGVDEVDFGGTELYCEDADGSGQVVPFIRYQEDELIDNEEYTFEIEVLQIDGTLTSMTPSFCDIQLIDDDDNPITITGVGTYKGRATRSTYDATYNHFKAIINGTPDIAVTMTVFPYNSLGNSVPAYSNTASSILHYLITNPIHGLGASVDLASYLSLTSRNMEKLSTAGYWEARSVIGMALTKQQNLSKVIEVVRGYARANLSIDNGVYKFFPLRPATETFSLTDSLVQDLDITLKDLRDLPNVVRVYYTDTSETPWKDNFVEIQTDEVTNSTEFKRMARYNMPGLQTRTSALRFAYDIINQRLRTFTAKFKAREAIYDHLEGETFTLTTQKLGGVGYKMKLFKKQLVAPGVFECYAEREDDSIYSNEIADFDPGNGTITDPDPLNVLDTEELAIEIQTPRHETGVYFSRLFVQWTATAYAYNHTYRLKLYEVSSPEVLIGNVDLERWEEEYMFPIIQEGNTYRVELYVVGFGGTISTGVTETIFADGKNFPPTNVPFLNAANNNGQVFLTWGQATDNQEIVRYTIQYGPAGFEWDDDDARLLLPRIDALSLATDNVPAGTWDFLIKAVDNAFNESADATRFEDLVVDVPASLYPVASGGVSISEKDSIGFSAFPSERLTFSFGRFTEAYYTNKLDYMMTTSSTWAELFPNAMNTYTVDPFVEMGDGAFSVFLTGNFDAGDEYFAVWSIDPVAHLEVLNFNIISGGNVFEFYTKNGNPATLKNRVKVEIQLSTDAVSWKSYESFYVKASARYMRLKVSVTDPDVHTMIFRTGNVACSVQAVVIEQAYQQTITGVSNTVNLDQPADQILAMTATCLGTSSYFATIEPVGTAPFTQVEISVFDDTGAAAGVPVDVSGLLRYI